MREIKFRGISQYTGKFVYGQLLRGDNNYSIVVDFGTISDIKIEPIIKGTQGQYTGLKDINGCEVYEHHIVKLFVTRTITLNVAVSFQGGMFGAENIPEGYGYRPEFYSLKSLLDNSYGFEVVGNIYENPELLK